MDEIPEALRERTHLKKSSQPSLGLLLGGLLGLGAVIFILTTFLFRSPPQTTSQNPSNSVANPSAPPEEIDNLLGHLPYQEAPESALKPITPDGRIRLRKVAAERFLAMQAAAKTKGIILVPLSGFRAVSQQQELFFKVKEQRNQEITKRAEVSAPPGYSEHHTGYALDISDGKVPGTNLKPDFENTAAFHWLKNNANKYSFELSFPKNNLQGVSYEPWHWRFVGDRDSLETFYKARTLKKYLKNQEATMNNEQ
jgi:D-alanyl-D-alanine carboxypeptidase